jgi:hypothetical protein
MLNKKITFRIIAVCCVAIGIFLGPSRYDAFDTTKNILLAGIELLFVSVGFYFWILSGGNGSPVDQEAHNQSHENDA